MATKNKVEVKIGGSEYTLVGTEAVEYLQRVALYIDKKMNEITRFNSKLGTSMAAVLTAVNVADDFFKSRENELAMKNQYSQMTKELEKLREEARKLKSENRFLEDRNSSLQLELAKRENELNEIKDYQDMNARQKIS